MKTKIMIVEDEPILALMYCKSLEKYNYDVSGIVTTGEDAVQKAGELNPDIVLMDIILEGEMDGIEAAAIINEKYNIPVIFITGNNDKSTKNRALATKPLDYLLKPINIESLHRIINTL